MLNGLKVLDLTSVVFGPYCTQILVDLGAEVLKVEQPGVGDAFRWSGRANATPGMAPAWMAINSGKQSIELDLKDQAARETILSLVPTTDVLVVNIRPAALARLGLDYETLHAINPRLVYVHCLGFGQDGPYADLQAYDDVIQAASGTATLLSRVDGNPEPRYLPSLIADKVAGLHAAYGTLAALLHRERTGEGQLVEVPMFEAFTGFMLLEHLSGLTFDPPNAPVGYFRQIDPDRQPFPCSDGYVSIVAYTDGAWEKIFNLLGEPEFLSRSGLTSPKLRSRSHSFLYQAMREFTRRFTSDDLVERCHRAQIPAQRVRDLADILEDPQLNEVGFFQKSEHPTEGLYIKTAPPIRFSAMQSQKHRHAPTLGQHNDKVRSPEYAPQIGFGWTNGVTADLSDSLREGGLQSNCTDSPTGSGSLG